MTRRKSLTLTICALFIFAFGLLSYLFASSLSPNEKAKAEVPSFAIADFPIGELRHFQSPNSPQIIYVHRTAEEHFNIFAVNQTANGTLFVLPDSFCTGIELQPKGYFCLGSKNDFGWDFTGKASVSWVYDFNFFDFRVIGKQARYGQGA